MSRRLLAVALVVLTMYAAFDAVPGTEASYVKRLATAVGTP